MKGDLRQYESLEEVAEQAFESGRNLRKFFGSDGTSYPDDDGERELMEGESDARFNRVSGEVICEFCGVPYWQHPYESRVLDRFNRPFLKRLCNGWFGKL
jgi:hypothetical protein